MSIEYNELLAMLMETRPEFATELYNCTDGPDLPDYDSITVSRRTITLPDHPNPLRVCVAAAYSKDGERVIALLFDAVLQPDPAQADAWLRFMTEAQRTLSCMVAFVVLCRDAKTADWALTSTTVGDIGCYVLPVVIPSLLANA
ncbi:hypothetical protein K3N28_04015 [Glycomyces sp. TRM65418]|uniref:hypothetical protein n=1 Tax=Glycomyces sp. TRM65418 TaxID=2867006 RepID=UPI001CE59FC2|nr:hypothetical protein [Glycomyces sp. TRM65418]MCC3762236.1 hypothetical protein [Glycomyces sp. TRM65418]QZD56295.1 hypothetical protein K3N28_03985 [Glycomyces sp. TRM65418]